MRDHYLARGASFIDPVTFRVIHNRTIGIPSRMKAALAPEKSRGKGRGIISHREGGREGDRPKEFGVKFSRHE